MTLAALPGDDLQDKIDWIGKRGGGEIAASGGHVHPEVLRITGSGVTFRGESKQSSTILCKGLKVSGMGHKVSDLWLYRNEFTDNPADRMLDVDGCVQCHFEDINLDGGYYALAVSRSADITFERIHPTFSTGTALVYVSNGASSIRFHTVRANQEYALQYDVGFPTPSSYKTWASGQQFNPGDIVQVGNYWYRCKTGGVSQSGPKPAFYHTDILDGPVTWRFMCHGAYRGIHLDTGCSIIQIDQGSDFTGPYINAVEITNYQGGMAPWDIKIDTITAHGPIYNGLCMVDGREVVIRNFNSYASTGPGIYGGPYAMAILGGDDVEIHTPQLYNWPVGIYDGLGGTPIRDGNIAGCQVGIQHTGVLNCTGTRFESKARGRTVTPTQKM